MKRFLGILLFFFALVVSGYAQDKVNELYNIVGKVFVDMKSDGYQLGDVAAYIRITVKELPERVAVASDNAGYFRIKELPAGQYTLCFDGVGLKKDTLVVVNSDINDMRVEIPLSEHLWSKDATPIISMIVNDYDEITPYKSFFAKYNIRSEVYNFKSLKANHQRLTLSVYSSELLQNLKIFDYLDSKYGYQWRFEAPKGVIGLDEELGVERLFSE